MAMSIVHARDISSPIEEVVMESQRSSCPACSNPTAPVSPGLGTEEEELVPVNVRFFSAEHR